MGFDLTLLLLFPPIAFLIFLLIGYLIFRFGGTIGLKLKMEGGKLKSYACGEDIPGGKVKQSFPFFYIAFFFTILHVAALMVATIPGGSIAILGIIYLIIVLICIAVLLAK